MVYYDEVDETPISKRKNLKVGEAKEVIRDMIYVLQQRKSPGLFLWGPPGIGKSAIIKQICKEEELEFKDLRLSLLDPVDLRGLPVFDNEKSQAKWIPPDFLPSVDDEPGILFLDELNSAPPNVQASAYQLILDKRIGNYELPENWVIIAAGNRDGDRSLVYVMPTALSNRFVHLDLECDLDDWKDWAYKSNVHESVISFLNYKPAYLFDFKPETEQRAFATPRSWDFMSQVVSAKDSVRNLNIIAPGLVGDSIATEFYSFYRLHKQIPKIEPILNGESDEIPKNLSVLYLLVGALLNHFQSKPLKKYRKTLVEYMTKLPIEFGVIMARDMLKVDGTIGFEKPFKLWADRNIESFASL